MIDRSHSAFATLALTSAVSLLLIASAPPPAPQSSIVDTKHNLSTSGPGAFRSTSEERVCIFCHTPHRSRSNAPLWNREDSLATYVPYTSSTFTGNMGQPTGSSKLCLSCHDGSIALGLIYSEGLVAMEPGHEYLDSGPGALGTSMHDDHPFSFDYAASKGGSSSEYVAPGSIAAPVTLDASGAVQCTSCHDPHDNTNGKFMVLPGEQGALCLSCHQPHGWGSASHSLSTAIWDGSGTDPWPHSQYTTVSDNACMNCHQPHNASHPDRLLTAPIEEDGCLVCHNGHVASKDIEADLMKPSAHSPYGTLNIHQRGEDPFSMARHVECQDCHEAHQIQAGSVAPPGVPGPLTGIDGIASSGAYIADIINGYELCYKCHGDTNAGVSYVSRDIAQTNVRLEFSAGNPSFHPIEAAGTNPLVPGLLNGLTETSIITCTDCHQSDTSPDAGGSGPAGPHGSNISPLLIASYSSVDWVPESAITYALCYRCHNRSDIIGDTGFSKHSRHVVSNQTSCSTCHDPHGISSTQGGALNHEHLMNFNTTIVTPNSDSLLKWESTGVQKGSCYLECHGNNHRPKNYR